MKHLRAAAFAVLSLFITLSLFADSVAAAFL